MNRQRTHYAEEPMTENLLWWLVLATLLISVPTPLSFQHIGSYTVSALRYTGVNCRPLNPSEKGNRTGNSKCCQINQRLRHFPCEKHLGIRFCEGFVRGVNTVPDLQEILKFILACPFLLKRGCPLFRNEDRPTLINGKNISARRESRKSRI